MASEAGVDTSATTYNILFVCTGNTCRSPMAEAVARAELGRRGWEHVAVASAGTSTEAGLAAAPFAIAVSRRRGIELSEHASRPLDRALVAWADLILVMGASHRASVDGLGGGAKVALLTEFATAQEGLGVPIPDPYGGSERIYEETMQELEGLISAALDRLAPILHP